MLIEYIDQAMERAVYEKLEDGAFSGRVPPCPGVIATGKTLAQCRRELREVLDGWLIVRLRHDDKIPPVAGINLNQPRRAHAVHA